MSLSTGTYVIKNVLSGNSLALLDPNDGTSVVGSAEQVGRVMHWNVVRLGNGKYTVENVEQASYANAGPRSPAGGYVVGRGTSQQLAIQETRRKDVYTISPADRTLYFWGLEDGDEETPVTLGTTATDSHNHWQFEHVKY
ncbi:uncharacterized protein B0H18DRAFT_1120185 [Fomitopsis serialis]|uniref:uncharacterized protein n=1 Tax=Fomitopsis serialis TaxID=139415 RepID=UPI00200842E8|nr:uncharacterized protein B0H18DRAFT_1120185 [Neoantrodia serialis]KAH9923825.1 hypothetical protein B0H18DRAFT_1120185 [Neoantrodia serialis]